MVPSATRGAPDGAGGVSDASEGMSAGRVMGGSVFQNRLRAHDSRGTLDGL
jgi:hypothetical protein